MRYNSEEICCEIENVALADFNKQLISGNRTYRYGQALSNAAFYYFKGNNDAISFLRRINGTDEDCFYKDDNINKFTIALKDYLNGVR